MLAPSIRVVTIGAREPADYRVRRTGEASGVVIDEKASGERCRFELPHPGDFHAFNLAFAVAAARTYGMAWDTIRDAVASYTPPGLRWQVEERNGVRVVNDAYNANPLSMRAALHAFAQAAVPGRKWLVLGGMMELGDAEEREHAALGECVAGGDWGGLIAVGELGGKIAQGALRAGWPSTATHCCATNSEASAALRDLVRAGDAVLLKASRAFRFEALADACVADDTEAD